MKDIRPLIPMNPEGLDEIARELLNESHAQKKDNDILNIKANINRSEYIRIPNTRILIAKQEILKGKDWNETHYELRDKGLFMPTAEIFMPYFLQVKKAAEGKIILYDGNNKSIAKDEATDIWKYLTTGYKNGCWTWLDNLFKAEDGKWYVYTNHKAVKNNKELIGTKSSLEQCIMDDCFVKLEFNKQGIPTKKSDEQEYKQGKNIYYWHPRNGTVAWFGADSDWASLDCGGDPSDSDGGLGVFACAREK